MLSAGSRRVGEVAQLQAIMKPIKLLSQGKQGHPSA